MIRSAITLLLLLFIFPLFHPATGQDEAVSPGIRKYIDADTALVGWIDITNLDVAKLAGFLQATFGEGPNKPEEIEEIRTALVQLNVKRVYWLADLAALPQGPTSFLLESDKAEATRLLIATLAAETGGVVERDGNVILAAATKESLDQLTTVRGNPSEDLLNAVSQCKDPNAMIVQTPILALTNVINVLPQLVGDDPQQIARAAEALVGIRTLTLSGKLPPTEATLRVATKSEASASLLADVWNRLTKQRVKDAAENVQLTVEGDNAIWNGHSLADASSAIEALKLMLDRGTPDDSVSSLRQIALAQHNFHDVHGHFAQQSLVDKDGKRLLSWRVLVLPYINENELYQKFRLNEPWDSPHNIALVREMPRVYRSYSSPELSKDGKTRFVGLLTEDSVFGRRGPAVSFRDILDGLSNTIMVVEAGVSKAVIWTKPEDVTVDTDQPLKSIIDDGGEGFFGCLCDGSARWFPATLDSGVLKSLLTMSGGEVIPEF